IGNTNHKRKRRCPDRKMVLALRFGYETEK
ncbi:unnamed protein product, partial [marine sediment metagenome]